MTTTLSPDQVAGTTRVLVIGDDPSVAEAVRRVVAQQNGTGVVVADGRNGLRNFFEERPDLVVLDIGQPGRDGWEVLERIRDLSEVPVLVLTTHDVEEERERGRAGGADDLLAKPFGAQELGVRVQALLRRSRAASTGAPQPAVYRDGNLEVDWPAREVRVDGEVVGLTKLEFQLLQTFVRHPGQALSTQQLLEQVWNDPFGIGPERVKFTVLRLRRKLGWQDDRKDVLEAIRGYGYRYTPLDDRERSR
ncbi:MAG TPA: response regulator transcription factor [Acidimicrobiales bacterium]|nr:response regulator transcription factor [Acidimicrobiales bacterium]